MYRSTTPLRLIMHKKWTLSLRILPIFFVLIALSCAAQQKDTLSKKLDSLNQQPKELKRKATDSIAPQNYNEATKITFKSYFQLLGSDFKQQLTAPFHIKSQDLPKVAELGLITGALFFADKPANRLALDIRNKSTGVINTSTYITRFGGAYEAYTLGTLALYGFIFKNEKIKTTTYLASQAYITAGAISFMLKFLTGRQRPIYYDPVTNLNSPTFHGPFYQFQKGPNGFKPDSYSYSSFPSGHTTVAFAAATVFAMEYKNRPLIPIVAYAAASLVGISRITEIKHWATDVFVGAALGYFCGRQVVNNYHRYAKVKSGTAKRKNRLNLNLSYLDGQLIPGLVYIFR